MQQVKFIDLGVTDYKEAWDYQEKLFGEVVKTKTDNRKLPLAEQIKTPNYLIFCEHNHVYTLGNSGDIKHLLINQTQLAEKKATFYETNRGGDITYHGP